MSLSALFGNAASELQSHTWTSPELQKLADVLSSIFSSTAPIQLSSPLVLENHTAQAAIQVVGNADSRAVEITTPGGQQASMGVGLGNTGIVANEYIPLPEFMFPPEMVNQWYSTASGKAGAVTNTPGELPDTTRAYNLQPASATGILPNNTPTGVGGETGQTFSGPGRPTGYPAFVQPPPDPVGEVSSGGGLGSGGKFKGAPTLIYAGQVPSIKGRQTGSGRPGQTHDMQVLTPWSEVFAYARHGTAGLELTVGNKRYFWPLNGGTGSGQTGTQTIVTAVSCNAGTLSVTTATLNFVLGLYTGTT